MATLYGRNGYRVTQALVNSIGLVGATITSQSDVDGGFQIQFQHTAGNACDSSGVAVLIKDFIPWTGISAEFWTTGSAACWTFMQPSGYGSTYGDGNIYTYDESLGDRCVKTYLAQDDAQFSSHAKANACDNDANNFMRYSTTTFRKCTFVRRRNVNGNIAGIHHGRACSEIGANSVTIIKNIYVWK